MTIDDITVEDFRAYERVRRSGAISMANWHAVAVLAGLTEVQVEVIQHNYRQLLKNFPIPEEVKEYRVIIGEADVPTIRSGQCLIRLKLTTFEEAHWHHKELLVPLTNYSGQRIYISAKSYILIPKITLSLVSIPPQADNNAIGKFIDSDVKQLQELEIGTAQVFLAAALPTARSPHRFPCCYCLARL